MRDLKELDKLESYLKLKGIPYKRHDQDLVLNSSGFPVRLEKHQIEVLRNGKRRWDAICHYGSYGCDMGLLEIMGDIVDRKKDGDTVVGYLTADDVIARAEKWL